MMISASHSSNYAIQLVKSTSQVRPSNTMGGGGDATQTHDEEFLPDHFAFRLVYTYVIHLKITSQTSSFSFCMLLNKDCRDFSQMPSRISGL